MKNISNGMERMIMMNMFNEDHNKTNKGPNSDWTQQPGYLGYDNFLINTFNEHNGLVMASRIAASTVRSHFISYNDILTLINPLDDNNMAFIPGLSTTLFMHTRHNDLSQYDGDMVSDGSIEDMVKNWSEDLDDNSGWRWRNCLFVFENTYESFNEFSNISDEILNIIERGPSNGIRVILLNIVDEENVPNFDFSNAIDPTNFNSIDVV